MDGHEVTIETIGVAGVRLDDNGSLQALAAGGLKRFRCPSLEISLDIPLDLALWRDGDGQMRGVVQGLDGPLPGALTKLTRDWQALELRPPLPDASATSPPDRAPR